MKFKNGSYFWLLYFLRRKLKGWVSLRHRLVFDLFCKRNNKHPFLKQYEQINIPYKNSDNPCHIQQSNSSAFVRAWIVRNKTRFIFKAVLVKLNELNKYSIGQVVNYMSIDTDSVVNAFPSFHSFWSLPLQICISLYLLYSQIGISFLVGVVFILVLIPINKVISDYIGKVQTKLMFFKDLRVKVG